MSHTRAFALFLLTAAAACRSTPPVEHRGPYQGARAAGEAPQMNSVVMLDARTADALNVQGTNARAQPTGGIAARALLGNRTDGELVVQARAVFYDNTSMPVDDTTEFKNVILPPRGQAGVEFNSTSTQASQYVIEIGEIR